MSPENIGSLLVARGGEYVLAAVDQLGVVRTLTKKDPSSEANNAAKIVDRFMIPIDIH